MFSYFSQSYSNIKMTPWRPGQREVANPQCLGCQEVEKLRCQRHQGVENCQCPGYQGGVATCLPLGYQGVKNHRNLGYRELRIPSVWDTSEWQISGVRDIGEFFFLLFIVFSNFKPFIQPLKQQSIKKQCESIITIQIHLVHF